MTLRISIAVFVALTLCPVLHGQVPNIQVSSPGSSDPEEVTIAINPANPLNLAAAANLNYYYYSFDGGLSWTEGRLQSIYGVHGDPSVAFDQEGALYFAHLSNPVNGYFIDRIVVQKSTDGGISWNNGTGVGYLYPKQQDKEWIFADMTQSQYRNSLYMAWTQFDRYGSTDSEDSTRIRFSRSTDFGATWSAPIIVSDKSGDCLDGNNTVEGAVPAVGPQGEVYLAWAGPWGIMFDRSLNGGATFGKDVFVSDQPGGWTHTISGIYRSNGLPVTVCDISHSQYRGNVYVLWSDYRNGNYDIFISKSCDGGTTWGQAVRVNDDETNRHQFFPWITVDPVTGVLYVVFYDRRESHLEWTDVYLAKSYDGGQTFINEKISDSSFYPRKNVFIGDYIAIAARDARVYPIWARMDGEALSIWTAPFTDSLAFTQVRDEDAVRRFHLHPNYPNPFNPVTTLSYELPEPSMVRIVVYDSRGSRVMVLAEAYQSSGLHTLNWNAGKLSTGVYLIHMTAGPYSETRKCLLIK